MRARTAVTALSLAGALLAGIQARADTPAAPAKPAASPTPQPAERVIETGFATWYGGHHAWHRTASGERFVPSMMTAAHRSIPLGTMVRVTDLASGRSVVVKVNDREPPHGRRCIDLSEGAATVLGIHRQGVAHVTIAAVNPNDDVEVAEAPDPAPIRRAHHHRRAR